MTTQVIKTSSSIVKAVTAAVLLAACTSSVVASDIHSEIAELGKNAIAEIRADFKLSVEDTRVELVKETSSEMMAVSEKEFTQLAEAAREAIKEDIIAQASFNAKLDMYAALDNTPYAQEDRMVVYASHNEAESIEVEALLPSIASYGEQLDQEFDSLVDEYVFDQINFSLVSDFFSVNRYVTFE